MKNSGKSNSKKRKLKLHKDRSAAGKTKRNFGLLLTIFGAVIMVLPLFFLVIYSLMGGQELYELCGSVLFEGEKMAGLRLFPLYPTMRVYVQLLLDSPEFFTAFWNSTIQTGGILSGQILVAVPAAWAFSRFSFPAKDALWFLYMLLMLLPFQVTMVSGYLVLNTLHLMDTHWAMILPGIFSTLPVFILRKSFSAIPAEMIEAAKVDGAGAFRIFMEVGIPLGKPGILSILILGFLECWNAIEQPLTYLKTKEYWPLSLYLSQITSTKAALVFTASIVMLLPALLLFFFGQDYLERGIVASGIKE